MGGRRYSFAEHHDTVVIHVRVSAEARAKVSKASFDASKAAGRYVSGAELIRGWIEEGLSALDQPNPDADLDRSAERVDRALEKATRP